MRSVSAIILAGGYSSRMGKNKAELDFHGVSLLRHQVDKARALGIEDIVIAGDCTPIVGTRAVTDVYPHRGPLSGIHAGLMAIREPRALVLAVDTPLVPEETLAALIEKYSGGISVLSHRGELEPLIGVYDKALFKVCEESLHGENSSLRRLFETVGVSTVEYSGDPALLTNCNTPEEYEKIQKL